MLSAAAPKYKRILLKLSGEILSGEREFGIDSDYLGKIVAEIKSVVALGVEVGIVIGGGNIFRWRDVKDQGLERVSADHMGMLGTAMNALALQNFLEKNEVSTRVMSAIEMRQIAEPYIRRRATRHLEKGRVVIFACGTGNPYFTTDTAASLRAMEISAQVLLKGTKVDGVYDKDPERFPDAVRYDKVSFLEVLQKQISVMDAAAISLCMENKLPIIVFDINGVGNLLRIVQGENIGTTVF